MPSSTISCNIHGKEIGPNIRTKNMGESRGTSIEQT